MIVYIWNRNKSEKYCSQGYFLGDYGGAFILLIVISVLLYFYATLCFSFVKN